MVACGERMLQLGLVYTVSQALGQGERGKGGTCIRKQHGVGSGGQQL